jgi:hypothetical protein
VRIAIIVEGRTEIAFLPHLREFLRTRLAGRMPKLDLVPYKGRVPKEDRLRREVDRLLTSGKDPADAVIALTDVYTGTGPRDFDDAADAKDKMSRWVGPNPRTFPHAAQYDFEAWLLPFWVEIQRLAISNRKAHWSSPEQVDHNYPPSSLLRDIFRMGKAKRAYVKRRDAHRILRGKDLLIAAQVCPELKAFLNTILTLCQAPAIP